MLGKLSLKARLWLLGSISVLAISILSLSSIWHAYYSKEIWASGLTGGRRLPDECVRRV